jgi:hypothetical protein
MPKKIKGTASERGRRFCRNEPKVSCISIELKSISRASAPRNARQHKKRFARGQVLKFIINQKELNKIINAPEYNKKDSKPSL